MVLHAQESTPRLPIGTTAFGLGGSHKRLPTNSITFGIGGGQQKDNTAVLTTFQYSITNYLKAAIDAGVGLIDDEDLNSLGEVPPALLGAISVGTLIPLGASGVEVYSAGRSAGGWIRVVDFGETLVDIRQFVLIGTAGVLRRFVIGDESDSDWEDAESNEADTVSEFTLFFEMSYRSRWAVQDARYLNQLDTEEKLEILGDVGIELDISPNTSVTAGTTLFFENTETAFHIGLNFHSLKRKELF